jgi:hypothetical protein
MWEVSTSHNPMATMISTSFPFHFRRCRPCSELLTGSLKKSQVNEVGFWPEHFLSQMDGTVSMYMAALLWVMFRDEAHSVSAMCNDE